MATTDPDMLALHAKIADLERRLNARIGQLEEKDRQRHFQITAIEKKLPA